MVSVMLNTPLVGTQRHRAPQPHTTIGSALGFCGEGILGGRCLCTGGQQRMLHLPVLLPGGVQLE